MSVIRRQHPLHDCCWLSEAGSFGPRIVLAYAALVVAWIVFIICTYPMVAKMIQRDISLAVESCRKKKHNCCWLHQWNDGHYKHPIYAADSCTKASDCLQHSVQYVQVIINFKAYFQTPELACQQ